jgi:hypothetical protein
MPKITSFSRERKLRQRLKDDLAWFAAKELTIRTKEDGLQRLRFNSAQRQVHARLEEQRNKDGRVRAVILKGRQQGMSTYVAARYYHRTIHSFGTKTFILTHEDSATSNLFDIVKRFHRNISEFCRPVTDADNRAELAFDELASGYAIGTARTASTGRSSTVQLFHGSEVAHWSNADSIVAGVMQAVPNRQSEVILESTANGLGNLFHEYWKDAEKGASDYQAIFIPWTMQAEYTELSAHLTFTKDERDLQKAFNLTDGQLAWRRKKISEFKTEANSDPEAFFQVEYPLTASEAFQAPGHKPFIDKRAVYRAVGKKIDPSGPLVIGCDPAGEGDEGDRSAIVWRAGRKCVRTWAEKGLDTMQLTGQLVKIIDRDKPARVFIDVTGGLGKGVYDRLRELGDPYRKIVRAVVFNSNPFYPAPSVGAGPRNRRAEMWMAMRQWLNGEAVNSDVISESVSIPPDNDLIRDLLGPAKQFEDSSGRTIMEPKSKMRSRGVASPDKADALALTFAEPVNGTAWKEAYHSDPDYGRAPWWQKHRADERPEWCL